jgi:membrane-bound lytic murein transglycosylase F
MLNKSFFTCLLICLLAACTAGGNDLEFHADLNEIRKKGKLTVLFENSTLSFFEYRGKKMGFEYEILDSFAKHIGLPLEVKVISKSNDFISSLKNGEGDMIAANIAISLKDRNRIDYSIPYYYTHQVLIQRNGDSVIHEAFDLGGKSIFVRGKSAFSRRLKHLQEEIGQSIKIKSLKSDPISEDLIEMVANEQLDFTIAHENLARISKELHPNLNIELPLSFKQKIAFGLRKNSSHLKKKLDRFLKEFCSSNHFIALKERYFDYLEESNKELVLVKKGQFSPFDAIFKKEASKFGWDWRFIASVAYKESRFNQNARGFGGAYGLMQFMPNTGPKYGVFPNSSPEIQISGGMKLIDKLYRSWSNIPNPVQRMKFTLASYNAGKGHIDDAQRLAAEYGLNPKIWDNHVSIMVQKLSQPEFYRSRLVKCGAYRGHANSYVKAVYEKYKEWGGD